MYSDCLQLDVGVHGTHGVNKGQAQERTERQTGELQVTSKIKIMRRIQHSMCYMLCVTEAVYSSCSKEERAFPP